MRSTWRASRSSISQGARSLESMHVFSSWISLGTHCSRRHWIPSRTPGSASKKTPRNHIFHFLPAPTWPLLGETEPTGLSPQRCILTLLDLACNWSLANANVTSWQWCHDTFQLRRFRFRVKDLVLSDGILWRANIFHWPVQHFFFVTIQGEGVFFVMPVTHSSLESSSSAVSCSCIQKVKHVLFEPPHEAT